MNPSERKNHKSRTFFSNLDALRFFAFLGIFIQHTLPSPIANTSVLFSSEVFKLIFSFNYLGVPFFFTLSSFLITFRILDDYHVTKCISLKKFYLRRGLRIWPIYFLVLGICFLVIPFIYDHIGAQAPTLPGFWPFLFFYANFYFIAHGVGFIYALIPLWSISVEEQFYVLWGLLMKLFHKHMYFIVLLCFLLSIIYCYYYLHILHQNRTNLKLHTMYALLDFCSGAFVAIAGFRKDGFYRFLKNLPGAIYPIVYISMIAYYVLESCACINPDLILSGIFYSICFALILFDQAFNNKRYFNAGKVPALNYLGKISYGLYIYHELVVTLSMKAFHFFRVGSNYFTMLWQTLITLLITIIVAQLSYHYFESYFLRQKHKWS